MRRKKFFIEFSLAARQVDTIAEMYTRWRHVLGNLSPRDAAALSFHVPVTYFQ